MYGKTNGLLTKMAKRYKTLEKRVKGLKSQLALALSSDEDTDDTDRQHLAAEIEQRLLIVNRLLTAEVASSPTNPASHRHLRRIAKTVESVEVGFNEWKKHSEIDPAADEYTSARASDEDSVSDHDAGNVRSDYVLGTGDQVCFRVRKGLVDVDVKLEPAGKSAERGGATVEEEKWGGKIGSYLGGLMTGVAFGMFLVALDHIRPLHCHAYLYPT